MAKKVSAKTPTQEARVIGEAEFKRLLKKLKNEEAEASQAKGRMGNAIAKSVEAHNLHTDALRVVRKYEKKNPAQAAEFYLHMQTYWDYLKLGQPEADLLETPAQRRKNMTKPEKDAHDAEQADAKAERGSANRREKPKDEPNRRVTAGTHVVKNGKVVPIEAEKEPAKELEKQAA